MGKTPFRFMAGGLLLMLAAFASLPAQKATSAPSQPTSPSTNTTGNPSSGGGMRGRREPCWQQAGIARDTIEKRRSIEQSAHSQVEAVCSDSSLTQQQKHQKIREIHAQTQQQLQGLITPQQEETLKSCQAARSGGNVPHPGSGKGPCGEALPAPSPTP